MRSVEVAVVEDAEARGGAGIGVADAVEQAVQEAAEGLEVLGPTPTPGSSRLAWTDRALGR
ncbi:hypothetical protein [Actinacidiphila paucisporea]|uniref:hypothetical protein n=1 Tax=Actinacidiphila paucisporea TaxID=310782 RepID=UPI001160F005|nr:hypothetical protein [Actinacidiphila paucisporea]